ncbi:MAG: hypothetical protein HFJ41_00350 [Clostridia bacterium]|nr:hypothetical protein [Clostridia bacterium]
MKIKPKETHYAKKKVIMIGECCKCKRTVIFEKIYIAHNGPYRWNFCTGCIQSIEEAKEASLIKRPTFDSVRKIY